MTRYDMTKLLYEVAQSARVTDQERAIFLAIADKGADLNKEADNTLKYSLFKGNNYYYRHMLKYINELLNKFKEENIINILNAYKNLVNTWHNLLFVMNENRK